MKTKMVMYNACVVSTLMYGSVTWTTYARQEKRLSSFHLRSIRRILGMSWQECPTPRSYPEPTFRACSPCSDSSGCVGWGMSTAWRMAASPKTFSMESWHLEGDTKAAHSCATRMSARDMKALDINTESWEDLVRPHDVESTLNQHLKTGEEKLVNAEVGRRACRKERKISNIPETTHKCDFCGRVCFSYIGLYSHKRLCNDRTDRTTRMYSHDQT